MNRSLPSWTIRAALALGLVAGLAACAAPGPGAQVRRPLVHGTPDCFDPAFARGYREIEDDVLLVDAGARHYLVEVEPTCWNIDSAVALGFKGDPVTGRVCGRFGDSVSMSNQSCRVMRVESLTREQVEMLTAEPAEATDAPPDE
jgi:hypothetical protein